MKKLPVILFVICLINFLLWLSGVTAATIAGFCLAISAVFFILTFITFMIEKAEAEEAHAK
jgi:hypothetical protein